MRQPLCRAAVAGALALIAAGAGADRLSYSYLDSTIMKEAR